MIETAPIAIVDDDQSVRKSLSRWIRSLGFRAEAYDSAEAFLQSDNLDHTACLVLDVKLPGMSGLDLQRHLNAVHPLPIIFVSAHGDQGVRERALAAGAIAFMNKPFSSDSLLQAIERVLKRASDAEDSSEPGGNGSK